MRRSEAVTVITAAALTGGLLAVASPFSGVALALTLVGAGILLGWVAALPRPAPGTPIWGDEDWRSMRPWLLWAVGFAVFEVWTLIAGDELAWPTYSAISDPALGHSGVRALAGASWVLAGVGLARVLRPRDAQQVRRGRVAFVATAYTVWAAATLADGPWWTPRDAPLNPAPGVDNLPPEVWPATAWLTIAAFVVVVAVPVWLHVRARRTGRGLDLPAALRATGSTLTGRWVAVFWWWWSGWHFLAR